MKLISYLTAMLLLGFCVTANAAITPGTWTSHTASTAVGSVGGVTINAMTTTSGSTAFHSIHPNRFGNGWNADFALGNDALALTTTSVDAGDSQSFSFSSPLLDGTLMYIENFDTTSVANVSITGGSATVLSTSMVAYAGGVLTTSNATANGDGDIILVLDGGVTDITLDYTSGGGGNGVFYTFAEPCAHAVPEPTSAVVMAGLFGLGGMFYVRRRKQQA